MQTLVLAAIVLAFTVFAILVTVPLLDRRGRITWLQVALGIGVGLVGAFLVLVSRVDLIPDDPEETVERVIVIAVTVVAVVGTWYRIARA